MNEDAAIIISNVSKDFQYSRARASTLKSLITGAFKSKQRVEANTQHALKNVSLTINKGEFFGIVGRNGSGKSTLLKMIAGIYQPNTGQISVTGKLVPFIELGVGFNPELTGRENVYLNGALLGFSRKEIEAQYQAIVEFAELDKFMDQQLKNYSSGMQVRLAFSMAVRAKADVLLIDEVLAVGDADFQRKCFDYFKKLKKEHTTVVFVSHDMAMVKEFCDRAALVEQSKLVSVDNPSNIANKYTQLFSRKTKLTSRFSGTEEGSRWGSGNVRVQDVVIDQQILSKDDASLSFTVKLQGKAENQNLMTGYAVKNSSGQLINGTNSWELEQKLPTLGIDKTCTVRWSCANIYEEGIYTIDVFAYGEDSQVYDMLSEVVSFEVKKKKTGFLANPQTMLKVEGSKA